MANVTSQRKGATFCFCTLRKLPFSCMLSIAVPASFSSWHLKPRLRSVRLHNTDVYTHLCEKRLPLSIQ